MSGLANLSPNGPAHSQHRARIVFDCRMTAWPAVFHRQIQDALRHTAICDRAVSLVNWNAIVQGVVTGVVGAALLALFAVLRYRVRDKIFRWRLRRELRCFSLGWNDEGVTIGIRNRLGKPFTVRRLVVTTNDRNFRSIPTREVHSNSKQEEPKLTWRQKRALKRGDLGFTPPTMEFGMACWQANPSAEGFATIDPFTKQDFLFAYPLIESDPDASPPSGFRITIEYEAWPEHRSILRWDIAHRADHIQKFFQDGRDRMRAARQKRTGTQ